MFNHLSCIIILDNHLNKEYNDNKVVRLKNGDSVYITMFIDVHHIFVRKVEDEDESFQNFIANVNSYCSSGIS